MTRKGPFTPEATRGRRAIAWPLALLALAFAASAPGQGWERVYEGMIGGALAQAFNGGMAITKPFFADIDNDGDLDLFVGRVSGDVRFYRNNGTPDTPSFTLADDQFLSLIGNSSPPQAGTHNSPAFVDVDADGDLDFVYGEYTGTIGFYRNDGSPEVPNFVSSSQYFGGINVGGFAQPAFCDIDADGDFDLFIGYGVLPGGGSGGIRFYRNTGTPTTPNFTLEAPGFLPAVTGADQHPAFADLDADGDHDLLVGTYGGEAVFLRNIGTPQAPNFAVEPSPLPAFPANRWLAPTFADLDGDQTLDCFLGGECGLLLYFENTGTSTSPAFATGSRSLPGISFDLEVGGWGWETGYHSTPTLVDIDADSDLDLFMGQYSPGRIAFYRNGGGPQMPNLTLVTDTFAGIDLGTHAVLTHPCFADIDTDGDLDLFVGRENGYVEYYRNDGNAWSPSHVLASATFLFVGSGAWAAPTAADLDADGDVDFVVGNRWGGLDYFQNNGTPSLPSFSSPVGMGLSPGLFAKPALWDEDGDGDFDLLVGAGQTFGTAHISLYRNIGTPTSAVFTLADSDYASIDPNYMYPAPSPGDFDGDGDFDLLVGSDRGALNYYRRRASHLAMGTTTVSPESGVYAQTVLEGSTLDLECSGETGVVTWTLVRNGSGATVNASTGLYTAGSTPGVDTVRARDDRGTPGDLSDDLVGQAHINVIDASQVTLAGRAVIMAGRKPSDPLWPTTNSLAHFIYRTLLYRGFSKENILYLNPDTAQDADGDGAADDIDGASSHAAIATALTTWASGSPSLFVYLIDHGQVIESAGSEEATIRLNETEVLTATELDGWLDALQASGTDALTVVVDCCQAGGFLPRCTPPLGEARIMVASANSLQPAFFSAGGLVSFTETFVGALGGGLTIGHAFDLAAGAMSFLQQPALDDDGDGVYDRDLDGALAELMTLGASFIAGADRPQIGQVPPNQTLAGGTTTATLWAAEVSSASALERVWASIAPPNFIPDAQTQPGEPVLGLPEVDLVWNGPNSRYEATVSTFTDLGAYAVRFHAQDIWGGVSFPKQIYINQTQSDERIVIACGEGDYDADSPWSFSDHLAKTAYETARARWLVDDKITWLSSASHAGVDSPPTQANLQSAISAASGISKFTVYLVGSGDASAFDIDGDGLPSDPEDITPAELDGWLDGLGTSTRVTAVLDFNQSGAWAGALTAPPGQERIIVTSCGVGEASWCEAGGLLSFSQWFFHGVFNGVNVSTSLNWARAAVRTVTSYTQNATLSDPSGVAQSTYLGAAFVTGAEAPTIGDCARDNATLWASGVWAPDGIDEVFALVVGPSTIDEVPLFYSAATGRWEATYTGFAPGVSYTVIFFVRDTHEQLSQPYEITFTTVPVELSVFSAD